MGGMELYAIKACLPTTDNGLYKITDDLFDFRMG